MTDNNRLNACPLLQNKHYQAPSVFTVESLLENARRQKNISESRVPKIGVLDPDGDLQKFLEKQNQLALNTSWPCYHTRLYNFTFKEMLLGLIPNVVGASFAVLVAEEFFASGGEVLFHLTSAGKVNPYNNSSRFLLIDKALRDEGTSYHYLPLSEFAYIKPDLQNTLKDYCSNTSHSVTMGSSWTTDAPFRETKGAIEAAREKGVISVEMEAAALYTLAQYRHKKIICIAHLTNEMGQAENDFEKGKEAGSTEALEIIWEIYSRIV